MALGGNAPFRILGQVVTNLKWVAMLRFPSDILQSEKGWVAMLRFFHAFLAIFQTWAKPFFGWVCSVLSNDGSNLIGNQIL